MKTSLWLVGATGVALGLVATVILWPEYSTDWPERSPSELALRVGAEIGRPDRAAAAVKSSNVASRVVDCLAPLARGAAVELPGQKDVAPPIRRFLGALSDQATKHSIPYLVADLAGLGASAVDAAPPSWLAQSRTRRVVPPARGGPLPPLRQEHFAALLVAPTLDAFIAAAWSNPGELRQRWSYATPAEQLVGRSVLGHALHVRGNALRAKMHELPAAALGLHELGVAIEQKVAAPAFFAILDAATVEHGLDANETWRRPLADREYNLAALAAIHGRPDILRTFVARGIRPPPPKNIAVVDEMALTWVATTADGGRSGPSAEALGEVAEQLAALGELPFLPSTAARLGLPLHPDIEAIVATEEVTNAVAELTALVGAARADVQRDEHVRTACQDQWRAAGIAVDARGLATKMAELDALRDRDQLAAKANVEQARRYLADADPDIARIAGPMGDALADGDWPTALSLMDDLAARLPSETRHLLAEGLLGRALYRGAPIGAFDELIDRNGGELPADAILSLVSGTWDGAFQVVSDLEERGLALGFVGVDGRNAISRLAEDYREGRHADDGQTVRWVGYLLAREVSPKPSSPGPDPLDNVLLAILGSHDASATAAGTAMAALLVAHGAPVEPSHEALVARIKAAMPEVHAKLVAVAPALG